MSDMQAESAGPRSFLTARPVLSLWTAAAIATLLLLAAVLVLVEHQRTADEQHAKAQQELLVRVIEEHAARTLDATAAAAGAVAEIAGAALVPPGTAAEASRLTVALDAVRTALRQAVAHQNHLRAMAVVQADGLVLAGAGSLQAGQRLSLAQLGVLPEAGQRRLLPVRPGRGLDDADSPPPQPRPITGVQVLPWVQGFATPQGTAWVIALLNPDALASFQRQTLQDARLASALVDFDGRWVAGMGLPAPLPADSLRSLPPLHQWLPQTEQATWQGAGLLPGERLASFRALRQYPLWVIVDQDLSSVRDLALQRLRWFLVASAAGLVLLLGLTALLARAARARTAAAERLQEAQGRLTERSQELHAVFTSVRELLFRTDTEGRLQLVNERWSAATGLQTEECLGRELVTLVAPESQDAVMRLLSTATDTLPRHAEVFVDTPTGRCRFEMTVVALFHGELLQGFAGSAVDITELLNTQLKLREQLAFNDALIENNPLPLVVRDLGNRYLRVNPAWEAFTGRPRHEVVGTRAELQHAPELAAVHETNDRELVTRGTGEIRYEARIRRADGELREVLVSKALIRDGHDTVVAIVGSFIDISDLRDAERTVRLARDAAESASQAKTEFIANISHELRTPLQAILGFSELGVMRSAREPRMNGMFVDIHKAGQRMLGLVNELLDLSKLDRASLQLVIEPVALRTMLDESVAELQPLAQAKSLALSVHCPPQPERFAADPSRLSQVLRNLLANAIRFSPKGAGIELLAREHRSDDGQAGLIITVADRGPGIPPNELESIFEPFVQSSFTKDGSGGTGLGLAIARRIVQAHGGWLRVRNREGGGAAFQVWLPLESQQEIASA